MCSICGRAGAVGPGEGDDVEAGRVFQQAVRFEIRERGPRHALLVAGRRRLRRVCRRRRRARFHFDEDDGAAVDGDDVEFADAQVDLPADDVVAEPLEIAGREIFATLAERLLARKPAGGNQRLQPSIAATWSIESATLRRGGVP